MSKPIKSFPNYKIGYFVNYVTANNNQPFQMVGTHSENETETPNASYINDDWFEYITTLSKNKRPIFNNGSIGFAENDISIIDDYIINNYSERELFTGDFYSICDYDFKPVNDSDISAPLIFRVLSRSKIRSLLENKRGEYNRLWEIETAEYNPLKDYDELTTERHSGTDTTAHSGTDTTTHSGKDTRQNSGIDTTTHSGTESTGRTGTDTLANSGTDTVNDSTFAFDSANAVDSGKSQTIHGKQEQTTYNTTETLTHNNSDALSHGLKSELTHGETVGLQHGESIGTTHGEVITVEKSGSKANNPELLTVHRDFWENFNILQVIAEDIIKTISI